MDLARAGARVRFRAAADGRVEHASDEGTFQRFWTDAVTFWCDAEPVMRKGYADVAGPPRAVTALDRDLVAQQAMVVRRHLARVAERLPAAAAGLRAATDAPDRLDMARVLRAAWEGPRDLEALLAAIRDRL